MKKFVLILALMMSASSSFAACFHFVNGKGPDRIGNYPFAAPASRVCTSEINGFAGPVVQIEFSDSQGALAIVGGDRNGASVTLSSGNINGGNVNVSGARVTIQASMGTLSIQAGRDFPQTYNIVQP
jgi:hypothetical protein